MRLAIPGFFAIASAGGAEVRVAAWTVEARSLVAASVGGASWGAMRVTISAAVASNCCGEVESWARVRRSSPKRSASVRGEALGLAQAHVAVVEADGETGEASGVEVEEVFQRRFRWGGWDVTVVWVAGSVRVPRGLGHALHLCC